jgi:membrane protein required for colicin V production
MGLSVGFIKGGLWLMCWVGAIFATLYGYPYVKTMGVEFLQSHDIITSEFLADMAVGAAIFIVSLIFLFMVSSVVTGWIRTSRLNMLDRSLGFLAGLVAAVFIVSAAYIPLASAWDKPEEQPGWFREARLRPVVEWASGIVQTLLPREIAEKLPGKTAAEREKSFEALVTPRQPAAKSDAPAAYTAQERDGMDRLLQGNR